MATRRLIIILTFLLLLLPPPPRADGLWLNEWRTLLSLSHSLMTRVANARAARGDHPGADRTRKIADHINLLGRGGGGGIWSMGWDYAWNYAWRGGFSSAEISRAAAELGAALGEAARMESDAERSNWALRNYARLLALSNSLFQSLLRAFSRSGPLREALLVLRREVTEGELLRDCLVVGAADLEGLLRIARDLFFSAASGDGEL